MYPKQKPLFNTKSISIKWSQKAQPEEDSPAMQKKEM